jgi:hypothetical protein
VLGEWRVGHLSSVEDGRGEEGDLATPAQEAMGRTFIWQEQVDRVVTDDGDRYRIDRFEGDDLTGEGSFLHVRQGNRYRWTTSGIRTHGGSLSPARACLAMLRVDTTSKSVRR